MAEKKILTWAYDALGNIVIFRCVHDANTGEYKDTMKPGRLNVAGTLVEPDSDDDGLTYNHEVIWGGDTVGPLHGLLKTLFGIIPVPYESLGDISAVEGTGDANEGLESEGGPGNIGLAFSLEKAQPNGAFNRVIMNTFGLFPAKKMGAGYAADVRLHAAYSQGEVVLGGAFGKSINQIKGILANEGKAGNFKAIVPCFAVPGPPYIVPEEYDNLMPGFDDANNEGPLILYSWDDDGNLVETELHEGDEIPPDHIIDLLNKVFRGGPIGADPTSLFDTSPAPSFVTPGDSTEQAIIDLDVQVKTNDDDIDTNADDITDLETNISNIEGVIPSHWIVGGGITWLAGSDQYNVQILGRLMANGVTRVMGVVGEMPWYYNHTESADIYLWLSCKAGTTSGNLRFSCCADWVQNGDSLLGTTTFHTIAAPTNTTTIQRISLGKSTGVPHANDRLLRVQLTRWGGDPFDSCDRSLYVHAIELNWATPITF